MLAALKFWTVTNVAWPSSQKENTKSSNDSNDWPNLVNIYLKRSDSAVDHCPGHLGNTHNARYENWVRAINILPLWWTTIWCFIKITNLENFISHFIRICESNSFLYRHLTDQANPVIQTIIIVNLYHEHATKFRKRCTVTKYNNA